MEETISYSFPVGTDPYLSGTQFSMDITLEAQPISSAPQEEGEDITGMHTRKTSVFNMIPLIIMAEEHHKDPILSIVYQYVAMGVKDKSSAMARITSEAVRKYLLQFD